MVIFRNDIIIFSDKYVSFNRDVDVKTAWKRWYKKAIHRSSKQIFGAESWIKKYPDRIFLDAHCQHKFPIELPELSEIRVHRVCVALGVYEACKEFYGGNSLGSLIVNSGIKGLAGHNEPFHIGHVHPDKGFVHVFEDFTLDAVFAELDTISDFIAYLRKRESFLTRANPIIVAAGEEQLLSIYLTNMNPDGEHDLVLPGTNGDEVDFISLDESFWDDMVQNEQYRAKKEADSISYAWDKLIEHFIKYGGIYDESGERHQSPSDLEWGLRFMASEPRIRRRQLAYALLNLMENTPQGKRATRVVYSNDFPEHVYIFLILPQLESETYEEYREHRKAILHAYCKVAKLRCPDAGYIIGLATEPRGTKGASEDLVVLDVRNWTDEMREEAEYIRREASLLLDSNVSLTEGMTQEYPEAASSNKPTKGQHKNKRNKKKKAINRNHMQNKSRKNNRKK